MAKNKKPTVALIYDFDGTLSPSNMQEYDFLKAIGVKDKQKFWAENAEMVSKQNAIEPGSPLPIHRHKKTSETVACLRGHLREIFYDDNGKVTETIELAPASDCVALNIPAGQWHTVEALESGTVIMEVKDGPYEPTGPEDILVL